MTHEEVALHARRGPQEGISPALNAALLFREDEDRARCDDCALLELVEAARDARDKACAGRLEHNQRVLGRLDPSSEDVGLAARGDGHRVGGGRGGGRRELGRGARAGSGAVRVRHG